MIATLNKIFALLSLKERKRMILLFVAILVMAFIEVVGVASIMPFMAVLASPNIIHSNQWLYWAYQMGNFTSSQTFLVFLGCTVLLALLFSNGFTALTTWLLLRFTYMLNYTISERLVIDYSKRPYLFFVDRNSADLNKNILAEVSQVVIGVFVPGMMMLAKIVVSLFIVFLLIAVEPILAIVISGLVGGIYIVIYLLAQKRLTRAGRIRLEMNRRCFQITAELFGGIKEVKTLGRQSEFIQRFSRAAKANAKAQISSQVISQLPRYGLEVLMFGGLLIIILYYLTIRNGVIQVLPLMALYAMAGYRMIPAMQQVFRSFTQIKFYLPAIDVLYKDIKEGNALNRIDSIKKSEEAFNKDIRLKGVDFIYPTAQFKALHDICVNIPCNSATAFVGSTGSGKTTLVDIILGLLEPTSGVVLIDGRELNHEMICAWQRKIGYVPQHIFLSDDSIERNIAFGISHEDIDRIAVEKAARIANIHDYVMTLDKGYDTVIGERGIRLSGGQRQRIGIARALYHNPDLIVMDEGTSALDGITEGVVMQAMETISRSKTVILIAHRLSTVRDCDTVYLMDNGRIMASGTYDELMAASSQFRAMARVDRVMPEQNSSD